MPTETKSRKGIGGPKTKEGKEKIRLNALKLGLYARSLEGMQAVADVIGVTFDEVHEKMIEYYRPQDPLEETLVRRIARCTWKLRLLETMEDYLINGLAVRDSPGKSLNDISVMERRTDVQLHRAIAALAHKRKVDQENSENKLNDLEPPSDSAPKPAPQAVHCSHSHPRRHARNQPSSITHKAMTRLRTTHRIGRRRQARTRILRSVIHPDLR